MPNLRSTLPRVIALLALVAICYSPTQSWSAVALTSLGKLLIAHGYGGAQLVHPGNSFRLPFNSNGKAGDLIIDTGAPYSLIFRGSLRKLGLTETATRHKVQGAFGGGRDTLGETIIRSFSTGNCTIQNVPVAVAADNEGAGIFRRYGTSDGLFGLREMLKFGAVLDLGNRLVFIRPGGPSQEVGAATKSMLTAQGYTPIPFTIARGHLVVPAVINGFGCRLIVDTGAYLTTIDRSTATKAKIGGMPTRLVAHGLGSSGREVAVATFPTLRIGQYEIKDASAIVTGLNSKMLGAGTPAETGGLLGADYLSMNSAVFDFNSNTLYLRAKPKS